MIRTGNAFFEKAKSKILQLLIFSFDKNTLLRDVITVSNPTIILCSGSALFIDL